MLPRIVLLAICALAIASVTGHNVTTELLKRLEVFSKKLEETTLQTYAAHYLKLEKLHSGSYFVFYDQSTKKSWFEANDFCISNGMRLLQVQDAQEHKTVINLIRTANIPDDTSLWFGLNDLNVESNFVYSGMKSQASKNFRNWNSGEPNNVYSAEFESRENCAEMLFKYGTAYWNDAPCTKKNLAFICEALSSCAVLFNL